MLKQIGVVDDYLVCVQQLETNGFRLIISLHDEEIFNCQMIFYTLYEAICSAENELVGGLDLTWAERLGVEVNFYDEDE